MEQNTIAVIWDFDKTLIPGYMQEPIFKKYKIDEQGFWKEVNELPQKYREKGIKVNPDTIYLNHIITCINQGIFKGLNNQILRELGSELEFYKGIPSIFQDIKNVVQNESKYKEFGIHVEHYIVSTGLSEMIRGSLINDYVDGIWGCEFIETPIRTNLEVREDVKEVVSEIKQVGYIIDNTSKTRAVFEINKGSNKYDYIDVNSKMEYDNRRVPFENMIYIADGPSDVPVFSILQQYGGKTLAVYPRGNYNLFSQVNNLMEDKRINMLGEADYSKDTAAYMWLIESVKLIANNIYAKHDGTNRKNIGTVPKHIV